MVFSFQIIKNTRCEIQGARCELGNKMHNTKKNAFVTEHWLKITGTMAHELQERRLYFTVICIFTILIILTILLFLIIIKPARDNRG